MTAVDKIKCRYAHSGMTSGVGGFQNLGVCLQAFPSFLPHPLPAYSRYFSRGLCSKTARKRLLRRLACYGPVYHTCCLLRSKLTVSYERLFRSCTCLSTAICQRRKTESLTTSYAVQLTVLVLMFLRNKSLNNPEVNISCNNRRIQLCQTRLHVYIHLTSASVLSFWTRYSRTNDRYCKNLFSSNLAMIAPWMM